MSVFDAPHPSALAEHHVVARLLAMGNQDSVIVQAGGSINFREMLPERDIPEKDIAPLRDAWVYMSAAEDARRLLETTGIAVIAGRPGTGRRGIAIRALLMESMRRTGGEDDYLKLMQVPTDWDKPETESLPVNQGRGYLIDVSAEIGIWENPVDVASGLLHYASRLREKGSCLVVICNEHGWPDHSLAMTTVRVRLEKPPPAKDVASRHLAELYRCPERAEWLDKGEFSGLAGNNSAPATAAQLALSISKVTDDNESRKKAAEELRQWPGHLNGIFAENDGNAEGRALLIAAAFLDGAPALDVQQAAQQLLGDARAEKRTVRDILGGPNLTARLKKLGVTVEDRRVSFSEKPGLGKAALHHIWEERVDLHEPLLKWIADLTAPGRPAAPYLDSIAYILTDLAIRHNDLRPIELAQAWAAPGATPQRLSLAAGMLAKAATSDALGTAVRAELRNWAASDSEQLAMITALVCQSDFSRAYPGQALVRLRWILQRPTRDGAVTAAEEAIRRMAAEMDLLPRVWDTVTTWIVQDQERAQAGNRAFLAIIDPRRDLSVAHALVAAAAEDTAFAGTLARGLASAINDGRLRAEARDVLRAWAIGIAEGTLPGTALALLDRVVDDHLTASPVSALLYGVPGEADDDGIIAVRQLLWERRWTPSLPMNDPQQS